MDIVRRDWCQLAANAGKEILNKILSDCSADDRVAFIHETLEKIAKDLKEGNIGLADLAITKSLTKDPSDYPDKKSLPHVQVRHKLRKLLPDYIFYLSKVRKARENVRNLVFDILTCLTFENCIVDYLLTCLCISGGVAHE